jgi:hypothetical protein
LESLALKVLGLYEDEARAKKLVGDKPGNNEAMVCLARTRKNAESSDRMFFKLRALAEKENFLVKKGKKEYEDARRALNQVQQNEPVA